MSEQRYWGIYAQGDNAWFKRSDGEIFYYPSPRIAQAHLSEFQKFPGYEHCVVKEFDESVGPIPKPDAGRSKDYNPGHDLPDLDNRS